MSPPHYAKLHHVLLLLTAVLKYNSCTVQFIHLKSTAQCFYSICIVVHLSPQLILEHLVNPRKKKKKKNLTVTLHSLFPLVPSNH